MILESKYIISKEESSKIRSLNQDKDDFKMIFGKTTFMKLFWGVTSLIIGLISILNLSKVDGFLIYIFGIFFFVIGLFVIFNNQKKYFIAIIENGFLSRTLNDKCFLIPLTEIKSVSFQNKKKKIVYRMKDIGANSSKEAMNEYSLIIDSFEQKIDLDFAFSGIKLGDLLFFLSENGIIISEDD